MQFRKELFQLKDRLSRFLNGISLKMDYRNHRIVATSNILKIFLSLYANLKYPYKDNLGYPVSINQYHYKLSYFVKELPHLKSIEFELDKNTIKRFSDCTDFTAAALLSYRLERNFISYFVKNSFFYVRKIKKNGRLLWSIELYYIKDYISEMWHEESEEYIKLMNDLDEDVKYTMYRFSSARYNDAYIRYEKKFWKLQKKKLKYKVKILKKNINSDCARLIKEYSTIDKDYHAMGKYIDKKYRKEFLLKSKKLHKKTLKSKLNILERHINPDLSKKIKEYYWMSATDYIQKKYINNDFIQIKTYDENILADINCTSSEWDYPTNLFWPMSETCPSY